MNLSAPNHTGANLDVLPGFRPFAALWGGEKPAYPSEGAARWAFHRNRDALVEAAAVAFHRGRWLVHEERFPAALEKVALDEARSRLGCASPVATVNRQPSTRGAP